MNVPGRLRTTPVCRNYVLQAVAIAAGRIAERRTRMDIGFMARRHAGIAVALLALCLAAGARADDEQEPSQPQPAATPAAPAPSGQKGGAGRGNAATTPPAAEQHRLPPD